MLKLSDARHVLGAAAGLLLALLSPTTQARELVISQVAPFSGPQAVTGKAIHAGARLYIDYINARGGINGNTLRLVTHDDAQKPSATLELIKTSITEDHPVALLGTVGSDNLAGVVADGILARNNLPLVGAVSGASAIVNDPYCFVVKAGYQAEVSRFVQLMATLGIRRIGLLYQDDALGRDVRTAATEAARQAGVSLVVESGYPRNTTEVTPGVEAIVKAAPQAIFLGATTNAAIEFVRQYRGKGGSAPLYGMSIIDTQQLHQRLGPDVSRGYAFATVLPLSDDATQPVSREYLRLRDAHPDPDLSARSMEGYIAARLLVTALQKTTANPSSADLQKALTQGPFNLDGYTLDFSRPGKPGASQVDFAIIGADGRILR